MQTKHTPAPWGSDRHSDSNDVIVRSNGNIVANCSIDFEDHLNNEDEIEANAKLIAAAPEMLETLKRIIKEYDLEIVKGIDAKPIRNLINSL